jgi:di/tricarboxylate transporter
MNPDMLVVLGLVVAAILLFATERYPVDLVALMLMAALLVTGIITADEGLVGFANSATVTVGAMFVLSAGLFKTGVVNLLGGWVVRLFRFRVVVALIATMILIGFLSAFMNNTPVVAIFIPIMVGVARETNRSVSKLLMPLSFAAMFGGVCTLIGTSTNLLVNTIAVRHGQEPFGMFEFAPLGLIFFAVGTAYMLLVGIRLIPDHRAEDIVEEYGMGDYLTEIILQPNARSVGKTLDTCPLVTEVGVEILEVLRDDRRLRLPPSRTVLRAGDVLRVVANVEKIKELQERQGILLKASRKWQDEEVGGDDVVLVEAVIAPNSALIGKTLKQARFRDVYGATALAIRHRGTLMREHVGTTRLGAGDSLLIEALTIDIERLKDSGAFVFVSEVGLPRFRKRKILPAVAILVGVIATASLGIIPITASALIGTVLLVLTRCITLEEAYAAVDWKVIFLLAGALTLGFAMEKTGAAGALAMPLNYLGPLGPLALVAALYLLTSLLTETMSNNATAVLLAPIAIAAAEGLGYSPRPFLMAIAFAASASFMTPVGYQTNTMIYGVGRYRFADFLRVGTPLNIIFWIVAVIFIPRFWPF